MKDKYIIYSPEHPCCFKSAVLCISAETGAEHRIADVMNKRTARLICRLLEAKGINYSDIMEGD